MKKTGIGQFVSSGAREQKVPLWVQVRQRKLRNIHSECVAERKTAGGCFNMQVKLKLHPTAVLGSVPPKLAAGKHVFSVVSSRFPLE